MGSTARRGRLVPNLENSPWSSAACGGFGCFFSFSNDHLQLFHVRKPNSLNNRNFSLPLLFSLEDLPRCLLHRSLGPLRRENEFASLMCRLIALLLFSHVLLQPVAEAKLGCSSLMHHQVCCEKIPNIFPLEFPVFTLLCFRSRFCAQTKRVFCVLSLMREANRNRGRGLL